MSPLPLNAIASLVIVTGDLGEDWNGPQIPFALHRSNPPKLEVEPDEYQISHGSPLLPSPSSCPLPPPGNLSLHIRLGPRISKPGRVGAVYETECYIHDNVHGFSIPPLVVKIAKPKMDEDLVKEASIYSEMLCLQGSAVAGCYGLFQFRSFEHFDFGPVSVLLLERLGEHLPFGKGPNSIPASAYDDLKDVSSDLIKLGIEHGDIRWNNILSTGSHPRLPSPFTNRVYQWCFVDFDRARKRTSDQVYGHYASYRERVWLNTPDGIIVEPWE
ncbi:hypothetical protein QCA50_005375 [Cerrena zonata]|uniref:Protein kinase domain-containing protein n=1 Tax=Cerrena zonata TaxID=2478898 RepID=A0AAW0GLJ4_9APHY